MLCTFQTVDATNCTCLAQYTTSSDFAPTNNCVELVGMNRTTAAIELALAGFMLVAAMYLVNKMVSDINSGKKSAIEARVVRKKIKHVLILWVPYLFFLSLVVIDAAIAVALPRSSIAYKTIFGLAFYMQIEMDVQFIERVLNADGALKLPEWPLMWLLRPAAALLALYCIIMGIYPVGTSLNIMMPLACVLLVWVLFMLIYLDEWIRVTEQTPPTSNIFFMLNYFQLIRLGFLISTIIALGFIPSTNGSTTSMANASWTAATLIFTLVLMARLTLLTRDIS